MYNLKTFLHSKNAWPTFNATICPQVMTFLVDFLGLSFFFGNAGELSGNTAVGSY